MAIGESTGAAPEKLEFPTLKPTLNGNFFQLPTKGRLKAARQVILRSKLVHDDTALPSF